jgi:CRP-like cAMP-binding protein
MQLKIAQTAKELDDVFWLRHQVYIMEEGKFGGKPLANRRIVDRFDAFPQNLNIIAYDGQEPVGTMRIGMDSGLGLATEKYHELTPYREEMAAKWRQEHGHPTRDACAGQLAVRKRWKKRRDVIRALIKMAIGIWHSWEVTHVYANVVEETVSMYDRLGFSPLADKQWVESVGYSVIPIRASMDDLYRWAFSYLQDDLLDAYHGHVERLLLQPGELLFSEGEIGDHAYLVDEGLIKVTRGDVSGCELILATLEQGELFGEQALIDRHPRSATATAIKATELIVLDRETFQRRLQTEPRLMELVMKNFSKRIRRMGDLAIVLAYGASHQRLSFALQALRKEAKSDSKTARSFVVKIGPRELANLAAVTEENATEYLESCKSTGVLDYSARSIHFHDRRNSPTQVGKMQ